MRLFETISSLLTLPLIAVLFFASPWQSGTYLVCGLLVAALLVHLACEGAHWQMYPLYLATAILLSFTIADGRLPEWLHEAGGPCCLLLVVCSAAFSWALPMFRLPQPAGPHQVGMRLVHIVDPTRVDEHGMLASGHREWMVQLWYPADPFRQKRAVYRRRAETTFYSSYQSVLRTHSLQDAPVLASGAPYPVLIFNPAWTGQRTQSTFLMEELASHGFVVAAVDHTYYGGRIAFPDGRIVDSRYAPPLGNFENSTVEDQDNLGAKYAGIGAENDMAVLDGLAAMNSDTSSPFYGKLNTDRVGALGHSLGGAAAAEACLRDPRIVAAANLDGWMFGRAGREGLQKPLMLIYETRETAKLSAPPSRGAPEAERQYWQMQQLDTARMDATLRNNGGYRLFIEGATHWNFSDRALYSPLRRLTDAGTIDARRGYWIIGSYVVAFFSKYLKHAHEPLLEATSKAFPEVTFEKWPSVLPVEF